MKINNTKSFYNSLKSFNLAKGIQINKRKLQKNPKRKIKTFGYDLLGMNLFLFAIAPLLLIYDFFIEDDTWITIYGFLLILIWIITIIRTLLFILFFLQKKNNIDKIQIEKNNLIVTNKKNKITTYSWQEIDFIILTCHDIIIIGQKKLMLILSKEPKIIQHIEESFQKNQINVPILNKENQTDKKNPVCLWIKYLLLFLIIGFIYSFILQKDNIILEEEIGEIKFSSQVLDDTIKSKGRNAIFEKILKEYLKKYYELKKNYDQINPVNFFENYSINDLIFRPKKLKEYKEQLESHKENSLKMLEQLENLLQEETIKKYAQEQTDFEFDLNFFYQKISFVLENDQNKSWKEEKQKIIEKTPYLNNLLSILLKEDASWFVEEEKIYFQNEEEYQIYLTNYNLFHDFPLIDSGENL